MLAVPLFTLVLILLWGSPPCLAEHRFGDDGAVSISGLMQLRYDGRSLSDGEGEDHKLHQVVDVTLRENKWDHFKFTLSGDLTEDLDGRADEDEIDRTRTIRDTWDSSTHGFLYVCEAEFHGSGPLDYARLGRQYVHHELDTTHLDGLNCLLKLDIFDKRVKPFVYGGIPVRLYDDEADYGDATEIGGGAHIFLDQWTRITLEHQYIREEPGVTGTFEDSGEDSYQQSAVAVRHNLFGKGYGYVSLYLLDDSPKHVNTMFSVLLDKVDLEIDASYFYQFDEIEKTPLAVPPYTGLVGTIKPYHNATLDITKGVYKDHVWVSGGTHWRLLDSGEEETEFNHSFHDEYLAVIIEDLPREGMHLSLQGDFWEVMDSSDEDSIVTVSGEIGYEQRKRFRLSLGTSYALYSYDYFEDTGEKTDVYSIHSNARYYMQPGLYVDGRYELDIYDIYEHRFVATVGMEL